MCKCTPAIRSFYCVNCVPHGKRLDGKNRIEISNNSHIPPDTITRNNERCRDPIVEANVNMLRSRSDVGIKKYGVPLGSIKNIEATLQHALEEALDMANYLQTALHKIRNGDHI
ncbi:hypothetical protein [Achromobacter phage shaaii_LB5]|nr:hypothetical protein [Achromobacter phage shaaii_LB5]